MLRFLEKLQHCSRAFNSGPILIELHTSVKYGNNIIDKLAFKNCRSKVKLTITFYRKNFVIALGLYLMRDFDIFYTTV